jgi:hypothetical protein
MIAMGQGDSVSRTDPVIELYMRDVDRSLLRRNLSLTPQQRLEQLQKLQQFAEELRRAGRKSARPGSST